MAAKYGTSTSIAELREKFYDIGSRLGWFAEPIDIVLEKINRVIEAKQSVRREDAIAQYNVESLCSQQNESLYNDSESQEGEQLLENNSGASPFTLPTKSLRERVLLKYDPERSTGSDSDSDLDSFLNKVRTPKPPCWNDSTEDILPNGMDDLMVDEDCFIEEVFVEEDDSDEDKENVKLPQTFKTLGQKFKTPNYPTSSKALQTPLSSRKIPATGGKPSRPLSAIEAIITPYSTQKQFKKNKDMLVKELFQLYNSTIFENQLPSDMSVTWNRNMRSTAGFCYYERIKNGVSTARIELADKVIDSSDRLRDTLVHEMCHAAAWIINGIRAGHGPIWKKWYAKHSYFLPELVDILNLLMSRSIAVLTATVASSFNRSSRKTVHLNQLEHRTSLLCLLKTITIKSSNLAWNTSTSCKNWVVNLVHSLQNSTNILVYPRFHVHVPLVLVGELPLGIETSFKRMRT